MEPIDRRTALMLGGAGLLSTTVGGVGLWRTYSSLPLDVVSHQAFREPEQLRSRDGLLEVRLEAASGSHVVAGRKVTTLAYNGGLPGPTLRVKPGDTIRILLVNSLDQPTNLHVHGLHVSPEGNGDNVFLRVDPGQSFAYEHILRDDHPPGVYWYHPHLHGSVADQVFGGLYGAIVVEDDVIPVARDRVMVISDTSLDSSGRVRAPSSMQMMMGREGDILLVNGQVAPVLQATTGERERWRVVNACTSRYLSLILENQQPELLGLDLGPLASPASEGRFLLAPGNRAEVIVILQEGRGVLRAEPFDRGVMGNMMGGGLNTSIPQGGEVASIEVSGPAQNRPAAAMPPPLEPRDLRGLPVAGTRTLSFEMDMAAGMMSSDGAGMGFTFDGAAFDPKRVDQNVSVGALEEWTIRNHSTLDHPFHLHVWAMQVIAQGGEPETSPQWRDVVNVPARSEVTVRIAFEDFAGTTVYHCHILDHEDRGMMGTVRVT
jgi:FtsP/CotA-like multicopper oxidase with cupredoxin domain